MLEYTVVCVVGGMWAAHYNGVILGAKASQITSLTIVYSTVYSGADQRIHERSAPLAFVWRINRGPVNSPHKWPVTRKMFPFDDVISKSNVFPGPNASNGETLLMDNVLIQINITKQADVCKDSSWNGKIKVIQRNENEFTTIEHQSGLYLQHYIAFVLVVDEMAYMLNNQALYISWMDIYNLKWHHSYKYRPIISARLVHKIMCFRD